ncbi:MAG TPA: YdcF family protein [Actinomycetota bacterium]|nr:YdcF family protein [Actinomycetota bacterium]
MSHGLAGIPHDVYEDARALFDFNQLHHELRPCSVAIGLGSHDLGVADLTAELFARRLFPLIVFSGANALTTRDRLPAGEAVHYRKRAVELGVPPDAILVEPRATNTRQNIEFSRCLLADRGIDPESAILTCRPLPATRSLCHVPAPLAESSCHLRLSPPLLRWLRGGHRRSSLRH